MRTNALMPVHAHHPFDAWTPAIARPVQARCRSLQCHHRTRVHGRRSIGMRPSGRGRCAARPGTTPADMRPVLPGWLCAAAGSRARYARPGSCRFRCLACCAPVGLVPKQPPTLIAIALTHGPVQLRVRRRRDADDCSAPPGAVDASVVDRDATLPGCRGVGVGRVKQPGRARLYFSLRQLMEPRFSTVLDSTSMSKPRRSRYFRVITEPLPTSDTP